MSGIYSADRAIVELYNAVGEHASETLGASIFSPPVPAGGARVLMVQAVTQNVRYTLSAGSTPTGVFGFQLAAGATPIFIQIGTNISPQFFREAPGAILHYQWLK